MIGSPMRWTPALVLLTGAVLTVGIKTQQDMPLRAPLAAVLPMVHRGYVGQDVEISAAERRVAGMSDYVMRSYRPAGEGGEGGMEGLATASFSVYVGYYESQTKGKTIHSPKNCLPGAGWEALTQTRAEVETASGTVSVNRYLLQRGTTRALVLYWYQGRGRVEANEYVVKWDLLRDAALHGRSDEALVRVIVPVTGTEEEAFAFAAKIAADLVPAVHEALPA